jgi:hypothetical protein
MNHRDDQETTSVSIETERKIETIKKINISPGSERDLYKSDSIKYEIGVR